MGDHNMIDKKEIDNHIEREEPTSDREVLDAHTMDEIMQHVIGQSYAASVDDSRGCYMGRNGYRLEPKGIVEAVRMALETFNISLEPPHDEPEESEDDESSL